MRTRQRTKCEGTNSPTSPWSLTLTLPKQDILHDLQLFTSMPDIRKGHREDGCEVSGERACEHQKGGGRATRRQKGKLPEAPLKRRLTTEGENRAVQNLFEFCREVWSKYSFHSK
eukprot:TRINITY_DN5161_c0_g1_i5.p2 TRINITY_DN5161_c0_g1~~TRINITY_DN5161_c0_g1_i5.p2  ORF type:complete len:115 (-),score=16.48 TRINITY_DN5161_c0_g1_i5:133-477(-)